jgi:hypothetical protein
MRYLEAKEKLGYLTPAEKEWRTDVYRAYTAFGGKLVP